jgi:hypothetical protein
MSYPPGTRRVTIETLAAGQPRAYADSVHHCRVTFEWVPYKKREPDEAFEFEPCVNWKEEVVRDKLKGLQCGFTEHRYPEDGQSIDDYFRTRLDWLRETAPGVWEFHTTAAYTD